MHATSAPARDAVSEINDAASRATGAAAGFFRACSLQCSRSDNAELRFLRSILYYYSLLCECGSAPVRFCANQSHFKSLIAFDALAALKIIQALRTHAAHSLEQNASDGLLLLTARSWFRPHTHADLPADGKQWAACA